MFCSKCGKEIDKFDSYCSSCGSSVVNNNKEIAGQQNDFSKRVLCNDGNCIGVIGIDGLCKVCKKPYIKDENTNRKFDEKIELFSIQRQNTNKTEKNKTFRNVLLVFIAGIFILALFSSNNDKENNSKSSPVVVDTPKPKTPAEIRKEKIEGNFSLWDGSHPGLEKIIKKTMNDPDSYDHEETTYVDKMDHLIVKTTFRGKNAFGGVVKNWVMAKTDLNGNVIEIIAQGP